MALNTLDWILLAVMLGACIAGLRKGLVESVAGLVAVGVGIAAALYFWEPVTIYLQDNYGLIGLLAEKLGGVLTLPAFDSTEGLVPTLFASVRYAYQGFAYHAARLIASGAVFLLLMLAAGFLASALLRIVGLLFEKGLLGTLNRLGGGLFGLARAVLILVVLTGVLSPVIEALARGQVEMAAAAQGYIKSSSLVPYLENLFLMLGRLSGVM